MPILEATSSVKYAIILGMEETKIKLFKERLEQELGEVEKELSNIGNKNTSVNPETPTDWEAKPADFDTDSADENETADKIEEYEENTAVLKNLEIRYNELKTALAKIEMNNYGACEVCGKPIEEDRLEANPAAKTCKDHM